MSRRAKTVLRTYARNIVNTSSCIDIRVPHTYPQYAKIYFFNSRFIVIRLYFIKETQLPDLYSIIFLYQRRSCHFIINPPAPPPRWNIKLEIGIRRKCLPPYHQIPGNSCTPYGFPIFCWLSPLSPHSWQKARDCRWWAARLSSPIRRSPGKALAKSRPIATANFSSVKFVVSHH